MAFQVYAELTANGTALTADSTNSSVGGVDVSAMVECFSLEFAVSNSVEGASTSSTALRRFSPLRLRKRSSGNSAELWQASLTNQNISGTFHLFDTNPEDGATRERFNIVLTNARVVSLSTCSPDTSNPASAAMAQYDVVELIPHTMRISDLVSSTEYEWSWSELV